jgi:predicted dehydrogenase
MKNLILAALLCAAPALGFGQGKAPLRIAVAGLSHGHVAEVTDAARRGEVEVAGIFESDPTVVAGNRLAKMYPALVYDDLGGMLDAVKPEAVMAYGSIYDHLSVVEACAPRGIHVMVEKPLAVSGEHARRMASLAREHGIHLLTNYETTWYPTNHKAREMVASGEIGPVTRINIFDGHQGPVEIGCGPEFLAWLTDPVLNGGGAVIDFGCYGANLATWLMDGQKPLSVYAVLKRQKPEVYPKVDDDATIILEYPGCSVEIMASWCWPSGRKDMHIYGKEGYIYQDTKTRMRYGREGGRIEEDLSEMTAPFNNPFAYLTSAVRGGITVGPEELSALENNLVVVDILDAARESARTKRAVVF